MSVITKTNCFPTTEVSATYEYSCLHF